MFSTLFSRLPLSSRLFVLALLLSLPFACKTTSHQDNSSKSLSNSGELRYLAMGDSLTFGDNLFIPVTAEARPDPEAFVSYATLLGKENFDGKYINISCPGETSASFLDEKARDNGCHETYRAKTKLKATYQGSQVDEMTRIIKANPNLELITMTIGGNDYFLAIKDCAAKNLIVTQGFKDCLKDTLPAALTLLTYRMKTIFAKAREAGFKGKLVIFNFNAQDYKKVDDLQTTIASNTALKQALANENVLIADTFAAYQERAKAFDGNICKAGIMIPNPNRMAALMQPCDVHPSLVGARINADLVLATIK